MLPPPNNRLKRSAKGFTLAELLIALAILGVIATFTIPKVLQAQQDGKSKAIAKETAAMISAAYQQYKLNNTVTGLSSIADFTPYMNYVQWDTASVMDGPEGSGSITCGGNYHCLLLHNGARLFYGPAEGFYATGATNALYFYVDPDGTYGGSTTGPSKSVCFWLYYNGRLTTWGNLLPNTVSRGYSGTQDTYNPDPSKDPSWFSWN